jgi:hypothetical protein
MEANPLIIVAQNEAEYNLERHAADITCNVDALAFFDRGLPFFQEIRINRRNKFSGAPDCFMIERGLNHAPLSLPDIPLAHHKTIAKE